MQASILQKVMYVQEITCRQNQWHWKKISKSSHCPRKCLSYIHSKDLLSCLMHSMKS